MRRIVEAVIAAPLLGVAAGTVASIPFLFIGFTDLGGLFLGALVGAVVALLISVVLGVPAFLLLRRLHVSSHWPFVALGVIFAMIGWGVASSPPTGIYWRLAHEGVFAIVSGVAGSLAFWYIAVHDNPQTKLR
jgi:hypothetical protein